MKLRWLPIDGALVLEPEGDADRRGFFTRGWCRSLLEDHGLEPALARSHVAVHHVAGEVRAPRCMAAPFEEALLVRSTRGSILAVLVDLRSGEPGDAVTVTLDTASRCGLYVPAGTAFGYQTLEDATEVFVQHAEIPAPDTIEQRLDAGAIEWPLPVVPARAAQRVAARASILDDSQTA